MRVLVVEDEPTAQRVIKMFLERSGYEPVLFDDGQKAFELASSADSPPLIILDWMLPGMDGPSLCKALRAAKPKIRPYVIMLSSKTGKEDVAAGLDAGADDYVSKPFNIGEMQARLRVACRAIQFQHEIQRQLDDNDRLNQRNNLLSEIISKQREQIALAVAPAPSSEVPDSDAFSHEDVRGALTVSVPELRLQLDGVCPCESVPPLDPVFYGAWNAVMVASTKHWTDLLVIGSGETLGYLFEKSLGRAPVNMVESQSFWAELARVVGLGLIRTAELKGRAGVLPMMSRTFPLGLGPQGNLPPLPAQTQAYELSIAGRQILMTLSAQPEAALTVAPKHLRELDILSEAFPPNFASSIPLFKEGAVMTDRFIEKLICREQDLQEEDTVLRVYRPSPLAKFIQRNS